MPELDDFKKLRSDAKRAVTVAASRLKHGVEYAMDSAPEMARTLDTKYCDVLDAAAEYRELCIEREVGTDYLVVAGLDFDQYEDDVENTYTQAIGEYKSYTDRLLSQNQTLSPSINGSNASSTVVLKKREIPKFSGMRKDWPEFKSVWQKLVVP